MIISWQVLVFEGRTFSAIGIGQRLFLECLNRFMDGTIMSEWGVLKIELFEAFEAVDIPVEKRSTAFPKVHSRICHGKYLRKLIAYEEILSPTIWTKRRIPVSHFGLHPDLHGIAEMGEKSPSSCEVGWMPGKPFANAYLGRVKFSTWKFSSRAAVCSSPS